MKDTKFTLQAPTTVQSSATIPGQETYIQVASKYPFQKEMRITLPHRVKAHYGATAPNDYDYRWFIALYSHGLTNNTPSSQWTVTTRGTTSAIDN